MRHSICRVSAIDTGALLSAISRASARAAGSSSSGACWLRTRPQSLASCALNKRPVKHHSNAVCMPTRRLRNQLDAASGVLPRRANTKPKRASVEATRMSIGNCIVMPKTATRPSRICAVNAFILSGWFSVTVAMPSSML